MKFSHFENSKDSLTAIVNKVANLLKVPINDPSIAEDGAEFHIWPAHMYTVDSAVNPIIVILSLLCIIYIIINIRKRPMRNISTAFSIVSIFSFLFFCAILRWEAFISRYMISYLALLCVVVGVQLQNMYDSRLVIRNIQYGLIGIICFCSILDFSGLVKYHKVISERYMLKDRIEAYYVSNPDWFQIHQVISDYIIDNQYKDIGFFCSEDHYEYPLIKMLGNRINCFEHVGVSNETEQYVDNKFNPDCIVVIGQYIDNQYEYNGVKYKISYDFGEGWNYILTRE